MSQPVQLLASLLTGAPDFSILANDAVWASIQQHAPRYGVAPLVAYVIRPHATGDQRTWCDQLLLHSWRRHSRMLAQLRFVADLLSEAGVPAISLKGPALAERHYNPAFLRKPAADLDFAVRAVDLDSACGALTEAGYMTEMPAAEALARSHHVILAHPSRPRVELHFRLSHMSMGISVDEFFERAVPIGLPDGRDILVLGPADQLLHLILHLVKERFGTFFHLCEIRRVLRAESDHIVEEAIRRAMQHRYCGALHLMDVAFRTTFEEPFLPAHINVPKTWMQSRLHLGLYDDFERWSEPGRRLNLAARLRGRWLDFQLTDSPHDALRAVGLLLQTARFQIYRRAWGTTKELVYAPVPTRDLPQ